MLYQLPLAPRYSQLTEEQLCAGIREFKAKLAERGYASSEDLAKLPGLAK